MILCFLMVANFVSACEEVLEILNGKMIEIFEYSRSLEIASQREEMALLWGDLFRQGVVEKQGLDQEFRPLFVTLQGVIEQVLTNELGRSVKSVTGVIHTPLPATPLCTRGEISPELVDASIAQDPARLLTVHTRVKILRDYLEKGGRLYVAYPKEGFSQRTLEQQAVYLEELARYPAQLLDWPLKCESLPEDLIGATYFFEDAHQRSFIFGIKMRQAKEPQDGSFALWFGSCEHASIGERVRDVADTVFGGDLPRP